jgi:hypothetical protein
MRIPDAELDVLLPAIAKESLDYPSPACTAALERLMTFATARGLNGAVRAARAILETETGPVGPVTRADVSEG